MEVLDGMISVFDLYKIGIGPSSSHTMGPMIAAKRFRDHIERSVPSCVGMEVVLYGSLAWTAKGHGTDRAICMGLMGEEPHRMDPDDVEPMMDQFAGEKRISLSDGRFVLFDQSFLRRTNCFPVIPMPCGFAPCRRTVVSSKKVSFIPLAAGSFLRKGKRPECGT